MKIFIILLCFVLVFCAGCRRRIPAAPPPSVIVYTPAPVVPALSISCPKCVNTVNVGDKFCSKCGTTLIIYSNCPKCSALLKGNYCSQCGNADKNKK